MSTRQLMRIAEVRRRLKSGEARELRMAARMTLSEAAKVAGISTASAWRYENGERSPRAAQALAYARLLERLERELSK